MDETQNADDVLATPCSLCYVPMSTGDCNHLLDVGDGRVVLKRSVWEGLVEDRLRLRQIDGTGAQDG